MIQFYLRKTSLFTARIQKLSMQRREQPRFHLARFTELMPFVCPNTERLLDEIARRRLIARQTERELVEWRIKIGHQFVEIKTVSHIAASIVRVGSVPIVPANFLQTMIYSAFGGTAL
jgi:hypothetical protein